MTQNTKNLLMIGGVAVVGYLIYKQMSKPKNFANYVDDDFFNVSGMGRTRVDALPDCPKCSKQGTCKSLTPLPNREPFTSLGIAGQRPEVACSETSTSGTAQTTISRRRM